MWQHWLSPRRCDVTSLSWTIMWSARGHGASVQCPAHLARDGQQWGISPDNQAQHAVTRWAQCDNKGKYHSPQNVRGSWCSVCMIRYLKEQKEKTKYWLDVRMYFGPQGSNKFLTFYWVKPKWNKMENLYPVPSESWLGEGSQEKLNENSPHFVVCMKIMFLLVFWDEKKTKQI